MSVIRMMSNAFFGGNHRDRCYYSSLAIRLLRYLGAQKIYICGRLSHSLGHLSHSLRRKGTIKCATSSCNRPNVLTHASPRTSLWLCSEYGLQTCPAERAGQRPRRPIMRVWNACRPQPRLSEIVAADAVAKISVFLFLRSNTGRSTHLDNNQYALPTNPLSLDELAI
jgi:hypothetical protein